MRPWRDRSYPAAVTRHRDALDAAAVVVLAVLAVAETTANDSLAARLPVTLGATLLVLGCTALRRRRPVEAAMVAGLVLPAQALLDGRAHSEVFTTVVAALLLAHATASRPPLRGALAGGTALLVGLLLAIAVEGDVFDGLLAAIVLGASWASGRVAHRLHAQAVELRALADQLAAERERSVHEAQLTERARIARDLHDIVAHHVSVIVVQAGGGRGALARDPVAAEQALRTIETTGRSALVEMRRLLGVLRSDDVARAPQPRLSDIGALLGPGDELEVRGDPVELEPGLDLTAYRVVQESLTNARRHGVAGARVRLEWQPQRLLLLVSNASLAATPGDRGHGLAGMRERVEMYDGSLEAGPDGTGGWVVRASLPLADLAVRA